MTSPSRVKTWPRNVHYWVSALLALALLPLLRHFNLPVRFNWVGLVYTFWMLLAAQSILVATLLYVAGFPASLGVAIQRFQAQKLRIPLVLAYFAVLVWASGWLRAFVLTVDTLAILELRERIKPKHFRFAMEAVLPPPSTCLPAYCWFPPITTLFFPRASLPQRMRPSIRSTRGFCTVPPSHACAIGQ